MNKFISSTILKFFIIPFVLLGLWLGLTFIYIFTFDTSLTVLSYSHPNESIQKQGNDKLLRGEKIRGEFVALEDNLGIVSIKFKTFIKPAYRDEDILVFRIKEKGAKNWYYENTYRNGLIYEVPLFPFGFPKIANSKGKTYSFEVESLKGNEGNSVALSNRGQIFFSKYQIPKSVILSNAQELSFFASKKLVSALFTTDIKFSSTIYILPFIFYILIISPLGKSVRFKLRILKKSLNIKPLRIVSTKLYWILLFVVFYDVLVIQVINDVVYVVVLILWILTLKFHSMKSKTSFFVALTLLLIAPLFLQLKDTQTAEKGTVWAFIFLVAGTIQILIESKISDRKKSTF